MKRTAAPSQTGKRARGWKAPRKTKAAVVKSSQGSRNYAQNRGTAVGRQIGFPPTMQFKHKYFASVSTTGSGTQQYRFRANGMYDPDQTGTGLQPLYFDQMSAIYNHFTVIASHIKVTSIPAGTTVEDPFRIALWINDDTTTTPTDFRNLVEQTSAVTSLTTGLNPTPVTLERWWNLSRCFGGRVGESRFTGSGSADPTEQSIFEIAVIAMDGGVSNVTVYHDVEIEYTVVWSELKDIAGS